MLRKTACPGLLLAVLTLLATGCGGGGESSHGGGAVAFPVTHYANSELTSYLPSVADFAGQWTPPSGEDFGGPAELVNPCLRPTHTPGLVHRARLYAINDVGAPDSELKASLLDFASTADADKYARQVAGASCSGVHFTQARLHGRCDRVVSLSTQVTDPGDTASLATLLCRRTNLVGAVSVLENGQIHPGPFNAAGLQAYLDIIQQRLTALQRSGRALP